jgi:hypothetical protein
LHEKYLDPLTLAHSPLTWSEGIGVIKTVRKTLLKKPSFGL